MGGGARTHREMQCGSPRYRWDHTRRRPEVGSRQCKTHHSNQIWPEIFLNCSTGGQSSNDAGHHKTTNRGSQNSGQGCMGSVTAGNGARGDTSKLLRFEQSHTTQK